MNTPILPHEPDRELIEHLRQIAKRADEHPETVCTLAELNQRLAATRRRLEHEHQNRR